MINDIAVGEGVYIVGAVVFLGAVIMFIIEAYKDWRFNQNGNGKRQ